MSTENQQHESSFRGAAIGYAVALEVISAFVAMIGLPFLGVWLDGRWGVFPCFFVMSLVVGCVSGSLSLWRVMQCCSSPSSPP